MTPSRPTTRRPTRASGCRSGCRGSSRACSPRAWCGRPRSVPSAVVVAVVSEETRTDSEQVAAALRARGIPVEVAPSAAKFGKQIRYADRRGVPFVWFPATAERAAGRDPSWGGGRGQGHPQRRAGGSRPGEVDATCPDLAPRWSPAAWWSDRGAVAGRRRRPAGDIRRSPRRSRAGRHGGLRSDAPEWSSCTRH